MQICVSLRFGVRIWSKNIRPTIMISEIQRINWFRRSTDLHHEANFVLTAIICCDLMLTESGKLVRCNVVLMYICI